MCLIVLSSNLLDETVPLYIHRRKSTTNFFFVKTCKFEIEYSEWKDNMKEI